MQVLLNIGLESKALGKIAPVTAISAARLNGLTVTRTAVVQSDTEPTLVLDVTLHGHDSVENTRTLRRLAEDLGRTASRSTARCPSPTSAPSSAPAPPSGAPSTPSSSSCSTAPACKSRWRRRPDMSIRKHGGLWFIRIGRLGINFYIARKR